MSISTKKDHLRDIFMLIRKESVTFEPKDMVRLDLQAKMKDGRVVRYSIGKVYYNQDDGQLCYRLHSDDGRVSPSKNGPRYLDCDLTSKELGRVADTVRRYVEMSIFRAKNIAEIESRVREMDGSISFPEDASAPTVFFDFNKNGNLLERPVLSVFIPEDGDGVLVTSRDRYNCPLDDLSDMGVSNILHCMENALSRKVEQKSGETEKPAADRKKQVAL